MQPRWGRFVWRDIKVLSRRELNLAGHRRALWSQPLVFFVMVVSLFHFSTDLEPEAMRRLAPAAIWVAALLAVLLSLERILHADFEDGSLEQMALLPQPFTMVLWVKLFVHWLIAGLPLAVMAPLYGYLIQLPAASVWALLLSLLLGTPVLVFLGSLIAALTMGLRRSSVLIGLLALPLYVPTLIFGSQTVSAAGHGLPIGGYLALLAALFFLAISLAPSALAVIVRMMLD